ncbi:MAG: NAD-dependent epimerase/dehydratase family protein [Spirochaetia bacterium]|nr:NAD-dependent epimerase/dehydratase family protein [Spirochaetia bacterium]
MNILITGSEGFFGKNLCISLEREKNINILKYDKEKNINDLQAFIKKADFIFHLAGENRPKDAKDFYKTNYNLTEKIIENLIHNEKKPFVFASSTQAELDNDYGKSKKMAEDALIAYSKKNKSKVFIYRLTNLFGKWCKPNYNSVVATFCYNIANDLPIQINNKNQEIELLYIDDVINSFKNILTDKKELKDISKIFYNINKTKKITLKELADYIYGFKTIRENHKIPNFSEEFTRNLYSVFVSYYNIKNLSYNALMKTDERGWLFELIKSDYFGQIFISKTRPGITRGNHYHDTKIEKFCVIQGDGLIRFRSLHNNSITEYKVDDKKIQIIDIPPGYTHSIENIGSNEMITIFWAFEEFDIKKSDTHYEKVIQ